MNLDLLRSFFLIAEHGSLNRAAERLRVSQSTLTRQMHALEHDVGGKLFERRSTGVALTGTGNALLRSARPALETLDHALAEARRLARGQSERLRIGYIMSAAADYVNPALAVLRREHPEVKVKLLDLSPGEQIAALRQGELDLAFLSDVSAGFAREFYVRRIASLPVFAALPEHHPLAAPRSLALAALRDEVFVGARETDMPGHNRWLEKACRAAGFRPRFLADADSLAHALSLVVSDGAIALVPEHVSRSPAPGLVFRPLAGTPTRWDLLMAWQRGKVSAPVRSLLAHCTLQAERRGRDPVES